MITIYDSKIKLLVPLFLGLFLASVLILAMPFKAQAVPSTFFVKSTGTGLADCSDWDNACDLQTALASAFDGDEIWVAEGIHYPAADASDQTVTFSLVPGVHVYGGFAGGETSLTERDWEAHPTVLSGDLERDDITDPNGVVTTTDNISGTNTYHVVMSTGVTETAVLDGFYITAGNAEGPNPDYKGGGMYNTGGPTLANLTFSANMAGTITGSSGAGGGLFSQNGTPTLTGVNFVNNFAYGPTWGGTSTGGGMHNSGGLPTLEDVMFTGNRVSDANYFGGGLYNINSSPTLTHVIFRQNEARQGGGLYNDNGDPILSDVLFEDNSTVDSSGGGMFNINGSPNLIDVTFRDNIANGSYQDGGGMATSYGSPTLTNVIFSSNHAAGYKASGGGMSNYNGSPSLINVIFNGNRSAYAGGMITSLGDPTLNGVTFAGNYSSDACLNHSSGNLTIVNSILWGNHPALQLTGSVISVTHSIVEGSYPGTGNLDIDPEFLDPIAASLAPTSTGNYRLRYDSPAIDVGNTLSVTVATDLDGNPRLVDGDDVIGAEVDMGAYEFQAYSLTLHHDPPAGGTVAVDPDQTSYGFSDIITLTATITPGWSFTGWSGDVTGTTTQVTHTVTADTVVTATFSHDEYSLMVYRDPEEGGTVSVDPNQATYHYGDIITLTATTNFAWIFAGWSGDVTGALAEVTHIITGTTEVTATFTLDQTFFHIFLPLLINP